MVLADRGFDIADSVGSLSSALKIPAFTRVKSQLSGIEVEQTRRIANVRIHIERVIGNIRKKYSLLSDTQPIDFLISVDGSKTLLDRIVHVCCTLSNMCDSVIPFDFKKCVAKKVLWECTMHCTNVRIRRADL